MAALLSGWLEAALWGLLAAASGVAGSAAGLYLRLDRRVLAVIMAFGAGTLLGAVAFDVLHAARARGGLGPTVGGFLAGALAFTLVDAYLDRRGAHRRKHSGGEAGPGPRAGAGLAILAGAVMDGLPESFALGVDHFSGHGISVALLAGIFLSTLPEGLSASAGMLRAGYPRRFIIGLWASVAVAAGLAAGAGFVLAEHLSGVTEAGILALAGGGVVAMAADTMMPEAFREGGNVVGLITALGMILTFVLAVR